MNFNKNEIFDSLEDCWKIYFESSTGINTVINVKRETSLKDLFKKYINKFQLPEEVIGKEIIFILYGKKLDDKSSKSIESFNIINGTSITVFDTRNILRGAWKITFNVTNGLETIMKVDPLKTIEDMIKSYANIIGIPEETIEKEIIFMYNNRILDTKSKEKVLSFLGDPSFIDVLDPSKILTLSISFIASTGLETFMQVDRTITIEDMIIKYLNKICLSESIIEKNIIFIYHNEILDPKSKKQ